MVYIHIRRIAGKLWVEFQEIRALLSLCSLFMGMLDIELR